MKSVVILSKKAKKHLTIVPLHILNKFEEWIYSVELKGITEMRKIPGFHDEPLKGQRKGQRSIRLSKSYRAIYTMYEKNENSIHIIIEEVTKHEY